MVTTTSNGNGNGNGNGGGGRMMEEQHAATSSATTAQEERPPRPPAAAAAAAKEEEEEEMVGYSTRRRRRRRCNGGLFSLLLLLLFLLLGLLLSSSSSSGRRRYYYYSFPSGRHGGGTAAAAAAAADDGSGDRGFDDEFDDRVERLLERHLREFRDVELLPRLIEHGQREERSHCDCDCSNSSGSGRRGAGEGGGESSSPRLPSLLSSAAAVGRGRKLRRPAGGGEERAPPPSPSATAADEAREEGRDLRRRKRRKIKKQRRKNKKRKAGYDATSFSGEEAGKGGKKKKKSAAAAAAPRQQKTKKTGKGGEHSMMLLLRELRGDVEGLHREFAALTERVRQLSVAAAAAAAAERRRKRRRPPQSKPNPPSPDTTSGGSDKTAKKNSAPTRGDTSAASSQKKKKRKTTPLRKVVNTLKAKVSTLEENLKRAEANIAGLALQLIGHVADKSIHFVREGEEPPPDDDDGGDVPSTETDAARCVNSIAHKIPSDVVLKSDTELVYPGRSAASSGNGDVALPLLAPITAYNWRGNDKFPEDNFELPIYKNLQRDDMDFWHYLVDELLLSRVPVVLLHGRGCYSPDDDDDFSGPGNLCPRYLRYFVDAVRMAGAENVMKVAMFDTNDGAKPALAGVERLNLMEPANWNYFWEYNIQIAFDILPRDWWFLLDGKPVIATWNLRDRNFINQEGNASRLIEWLKVQFKDRYGVEPAFILQDNWFHEDSTLTEEHAAGQHCWFSTVSDEIDSVSSLCPFNDQFWGVATPGFRDANTVAGCGEECREVTRRNGDTLIYALDRAVDANATMVMLEGWTDMVESAGFYRSEHWLYPTQYINIVRRYSDPEPETLRFQAEGADAFSDTTVLNLGKEYSDRALDVGKMPNGTGWYVGFTAVDEWLEYQNVELGCGRYRFTAQVATRNDNKKMHLEVGNETLPTVDVPYTGGLENYRLVHLGQINLLGGSYNLRLVFESTGGLNVDWFFVKRSSDCYCQLDEPAVI